MKISFVAPNLNEEPYLPTFLNSLCAQTFKDFELIIIDGESKDKSIEIIASYANRLKIKLIICGKRNIGYIRNLGSTRADGEILFHGSTDTYLPPDILERITTLFEQNQNLISVSGRTRPMGTSIIGKLAYKAFDLIRFLFTISPMPVKKYRPSGSFFVIKRDVFEQIGCFPCVCINEDGLLAQKLDEYLLKHDARVIFHLGLCVGHHAKRFEKVGGLKALFFYIYVFGNMFPFLRRFLIHIERMSARVFASRSDLKESKTLIK